MKTQQEEGTLQNNCHHKFFFVLPIKCCLVKFALEHVGVARIVARNRKNIGMAN